MLVILTMVMVMVMVMTILMVMADDNSDGGGVNGSHVTDDNGNG